MFVNLDHIAIAVKNLDESKSIYMGKLGFELVAEEELEERGLRLAILSGGGAPIELLEDTTGEGTVAKFIAKHGPGLHHLAFNVEDISKAMEELKARGMEFTTSEPSKGAGGKLIAFIHPRSTGGLMIELVQKR